MAVLTTYFSKPRGYYTFVGSGAILYIVFQGIEAVPFFLFLLKYVLDLVLIFTSEEICTTLYNINLGLYMTGLLYV